MVEIVQKIAHTANRFLLNKRNTTVKTDPENRELSFTNMHFFCYRITLILPINK